MFQPWIPKIRRTYRPLTLARAWDGGFQGSTGIYPVFNQINVPNYYDRQRSALPVMGNSISYQQFVPSSSVPTILRRYRRFRTILPSVAVTPSSNSTVRSEVVPIDVADNSTSSPQQLRFLGWLFGRPRVPAYPYPDYSSLEDAAGVYGSRFPANHAYPRPYPSSVVEECVELLDPMTGHVVEECQDVPPYYYK